MGKLLDFVGNLAALIGILICLVAGVSRLMGRPYVMNFEGMTLFVGGIAFMVMGCLAKLQKLGSAKS